MSMRSVQLIDQSRHLVATAQVTDEGDYFGGTVDLHQIPTPIRELFNEFEETVTGQMFIFLDALQMKIAALGIRAVFDDGGEFLVKDLQLFPSTCELSFRLNDEYKKVGVPVAAGAMNR